MCNSNEFIYQIVWGRIMKIWPSCFGTFSQSAEVCRRLNVVSAYSLPVHLSRNQRTAAVDHAHYSRPGRKRRQTVVVISSFFPRVTPCAGHDSGQCLSCGPLGNVERLSGENTEVCCLRLLPAAALHDVLTSVSREVALLGH